MNTRLVVSLLLTAACLPAANAVDMERRLRAMPPAHPRLFLPATGDRELIERMSADPWRKDLRDALLRRADAMLNTKPVERVLIGRRLLDKSRLALTRVLYLSLAWRLTTDRRYAERARLEMLAAAEFADWNPSHFLDVAEMTAALGIGYDWLYPFLDEHARALIREAIINKGLKPSLGADSWSRATHNWNQVCNGGMAVGALAIAESEPALAAKILARAVNTVPLAMHEYAPDGAYPEGASYWGYGTTYNVILIAALESALGTDFGLTRQPGFLATADYWLHVFGPTGLSFNYSDAGTRPAKLSAAQFWFAARRRQPYLLFTEWRKGPAQLEGDRAEALLPLWLPTSLKNPPEPPQLSWTGHGTTPVAFHRSGWDDNAVYIAIKGGSPNTNHAHMDIGSFVVDADGSRWADDLGMQDYNSLESKGINLWSKGQDAERWKIFRLSTAAHSVLMVNGASQRVDANAPIRSTKSGRTVVDLSPTYAGTLTNANRGIALLPDRTVLIQDELTAQSLASVRWAMLTRAEVRVNGPGRATLLRDGKSLQFEVLEPLGAELQLVATDPPPAPTDAPNPGTQLLTFTVKIAAGVSQRIRVKLTPASARPAPDEILTLANW